MIPKSLRNLVKNIPLTVPVCAVACLLYRSDSDFFMGVLATLVVQVLITSILRENLWTRWRKHIQITELILGAFTAILFAERFFLHMENNGIIDVLASVAGLNHQTCNTAVSLAGAVASIPCFAGIWGFAGQWAKKLQVAPAENALLRSSSTQLRGLMVIFMVLLHALSCPGFYIDSISYPSMEPYVNFINRATNPCGVFIFFTGYFYANRKDQSLRYSLQKIKSFGYKYWVILFVFLVTAVGICGYRPSIREILMEALTFERNVILFNWYVHFYVIIMLALPAVVYLNTKEDSSWAELPGFVLAWCAMVAANRIFANNATILMIMATLIQYFPVVAVGYFFSKFHLLDRTVTWLRNRIPSLVLGVVGILLVLLAVYLRYKLFRIKVWGEKIQTDTYLSPLLILGFVLIPINKIKPLKALLEILGKYSVEIWFLHALFFGNATRQVFQPLAYWPRHPVLVVCWILLLSLLMALLVVNLYPLPQKLLAWKNRKKTHPSDRGSL